VKSNLVFRGALRRRLFVRNWEKNITDVRIEPCAYSEDPLGYKAVFITKRGAPSHFEIGASLLELRQNNLSKAGYKAPMTERALVILSAKVGGAQGAGAALAG